MIKIISPLLYSVYQRNHLNRARVAIRGKAARKFEKVEAAFRPCGAGYDAKPKWQVIAGKSGNLTFGGHLDVPAGGWYTLKIRTMRRGKTVETGLVGKFGVGEVFITAGQSNFANYAEPRQKTKTRLVSSFNGSGWQISDDPQPICTGEMGSVLPALGDLLSDTLNLPVGFLCLAVGGTMVSHWDPDLKIPEDHRPLMHEALYVRYFKTYGPDFLKTYGARALLWHQGESDRESRYEDYYRSLKKLISRFKKDIGRDLPWIVATVGNSQMDRKFGAGARKGQAQVIEEGLALAGPDTDTINSRLRLPGSSHFNRKGLAIHARLWFAMIYYHLQTGKI